MNTEPLKEHQWLEQFVGEWTSEGEASMGPDKPVEKFKTTESVRSIGGVWIACEGQGGMPGGAPATMIATLGFDPAKQRFVGTFIASMETHMWVYEGSLDAAGKVLTLDTVGPSFAGDGKMAKYQDIHELKSPDHRVLTSRVLGDDGVWREIMTVEYRRKK